MNDLSTNWRQLRIFTSDFSAQWYVGLLATFVIPFAKKYPETPLWFTRYTGIRNTLGEDVADTDINALSFPYLVQDHQQQLHHSSLRFRFRVVTDEEIFLKSLLDSKFWWSGFLDFKAYENLSEGRFGSSIDTSARSRRANAVINLLDANCRYALDLLQENNGKWSFERNSDSLNRFSGNPFQTMAHLLLQIMGKNEVEPLPLYWSDPSHAPAHIFIPASTT